jgi:hypothetical protein
VVLWRDRWVVIVVMGANWIEELVYSISRTRPNLAARLLARHSQAVPMPKLVGGDRRWGGGVSGGSLAK